MAKIGDKVFLRYNDKGTPGKEIVGTRTRAYESTLSSSSSPGNTIRVKQVAVKTLFGLRWYDEDKVFRIEDEVLADRLVLQGSK